MPGRASRPPGRECTPGAELPERLLWTYRGQFPSKVELESGVTVPWAFIPDSSIHSRNMTVSMLAQFLKSTLTKRLQNQKRGLGREQARSHIWSDKDGK